MLFRKQRTDEEFLNGIRLQRAKQRRWAIPIMLLGVMMMVSGMAMSLHSSVLFDKLSEQATTVGVKLSEPDFGRFNYYAGRKIGFATALIVLFGFAIFMIGINQRTGARAENMLIEFHDRLNAAGLLDKEGRPGSIPRPGVPDEPRL